MKLRLERRPLLEISVRIEVLLFFSWCKQRRKQNTLFHVPEGRYAGR